MLTSSRFYVPFVHRFVYYEQVGLLNVDGYYNNLLALFNKGVEEGFIENSARQIVVSADNIQELMSKMNVKGTDDVGEKTGKKRKKWF